MGTSEIPVVRPLHGEFLGFKGVLSSMVRPVPVCVIDASPSSSLG